MEKSTPHCKLKRVKELIELDLVRATNVARMGATALDFDFEGMITVLQSLTSEDFYKSMTSHVDHKIWQDVYRPRVTTDAGEIDLYIKLTVVDDVLIVSFKEQ
jgi:motility quorum-sensing regulator / GCU-specific mRNA interferase toxin